MIIKIKKLLLLMLLVIPINSAVASDVFDDEFDDEDDIMALVDSVDPDAHISISKGSTITNNKVVDFVKTFDLNNLAAANEYFFTNPLNKRPLTTLPIFTLYHTNAVNQDLILKSFLLYSQTTKQFFTSSSAAISSYLELDQSNIMDKLNETIKDVDVPLILDLFKGGSVQERRLGIMLQLLKNYNNWSLEASLPIVYQERNFFISDAEVIRIQHKISEITGVQAIEQDDEYLMKHAVADKIGLGNIDLKIGYLFKNDNHLKLKVGGLVTMPTDINLIKGLIGSDFTKELVTPTASLKDVWCWYNEDQAKFKNFAIAFGEYSVRRLAAMVLDEPIGNYNHTELGSFLESKIAFNENVSLLFDCKFKYSLPKNELRFFNQAKDPSDFTTEALTPPSGLSTAEEEAFYDTEITFLNKHFVSSLFPTPTTAKISPKFNYQLTIGPRFEFGNYIFHFGYDLWYKSQEEIGTLIPLEKTDYPLNTNLGTKPSVTDHKIFLCVDLDHATPKHLWKISLRGDETIASSGIGSSFNITAKLSIDF